MLTAIAVVLLFFVLYNFTNLDAIKHAYDKKGFGGAIKISFSLLLHQIAGFFVK